MVKLAVQQPLERAEQGWGSFERFLCKELSLFASLVASWKTPFPMMSIFYLIQCSPFTWRWVFVESDTEQGPMQLLGTKPFCVSFSLITRNGLHSASMTFPEIPAVVNQGEKRRKQNSKRNNSVALGQGPSSPSTDTHKNIV